MFTNYLRYVTYVTYVTSQEFADAPCLFVAMVSFCIFLEIYMTLSFISLLNIALIRSHYLCVTILPVDDNG